MKVLATRLALVGGILAAFPLLADPAVDALFDESVVRRPGTGGRSLRSA